MERAILVQEKKEVIKHFDVWSATYEQEVWNRDRYFHKLIKKYVLNLIPKKERQKLLELGVGTGIYMEKFLKTFHFLVGIDISKEMLRISRKKLYKKGYNMFHLILADAESLPFRNKIFNMINCIEVLRHLPNPNKSLYNVLNEMNRILTNDGALLVTIPNILFPINVLSVLYYVIPRKIMKFFHRGIGFHYGGRYSFPHFPVLYNEPEDHMFNILYLRYLFKVTHFRISFLKGIFFFPACPKFLLTLFKRIDTILGTSFWAFLAYAFFFKLKRF